MILEGIEALENPRVKLTTPAHYLRAGAPTRYSRDSSGEQLFWLVDFDASNRAEVDLPGEATFTLEFEAGEVLRTFPELVTLEAGETRELFWSIDPGARVHGRLSDSSGAGISDAEVWLVRAKDAAPGADYINGMNPVGLSSACGRMLPPGHAVVEMRTGDGLSALREVELVVGQRQRLEFGLYPAEPDGSRRK